MTARPATLHKLAVQEQPARVPASIAGTATSVTAAAAKAMVVMR